MKISPLAQNPWRLPKKKEKEKASSLYSSERKVMKKNVSTTKIGS